MKKILSFFFQASFVACCSLITHSPITAQPISTDGTLEQPTEVTPTDAGVEINGGATRGSNLFHSFDNFSVPTGTEAHFNNHVGVDNILNRVTGGNISNIDGLIRANGGANLFLINPAGIVFGANASLDIGGSFFGSTADSLLFDEGGEFSATNSQAEPILTINAPIGLNFRDHPQSITNQSTANDVGLQVGTGKNISLIGGELNFEGGIVTAPGGRVELGGLSSKGKVGIRRDGSLTFPSSKPRANVTLTNGAEVNVAGDGGGYININARNLNLSQESQLLGGIAENNGLSNAQAGDITLDVTKAIALSESSSIQNRVNSNGIGDAGNIEISAYTLNLAEGSFVSSSTLGQGDGGNILANVQNTIALEDFGSDIISVVGESAMGDGGDITLQAKSISVANEARLSTIVFPSLEDSLGGQGNAGSIKLESESLTVSEGAGIFSANLGQGNGGDITIDTQQGLSITGQGRADPLDNSPNTAITSIVDSSTKANSGNIAINAGSFSLTDFTSIDASNYSAAGGNAGNVSIYARDNVLISESGINSLASLGNAGNIEIKANTINAENYSFVDSSNFGQGNSGDILFQANSIFMGTPFIRSQIFAGKAGNINIFAQDSLKIDGIGASASGITVDSFGSGSGGNINIQANSFALNNGAFLNAVANGTGNGGNIAIDVNTININQSLINTTSFERGRGGEVQINATESVEITGSGLSLLQENIVAPATQNPTFFENFKPEDVRDVGFQGIAAATLSSQGTAGGNIIIDTANLNIKEGGLIATATTGAGAAGNIIINTSSLLKVNEGLVSASTINTGPAGDVELNTAQLLVEGGGQITASSLAAGDGGSLSINATESVELRGIDSSGFVPSSLVVGSQLTSGTGNSGNLILTSPKLTIRDGAMITASTLGTGTGGNIQIYANDSVNLRNGASITVNSQGQGDAGKLKIATNSLTLERQSSLSAETFASTGGNIQLDVMDLLLLQENSTISTTAGSEGMGADGGNIQINANFVVAMPLENSDITANAFQGKGGSIQIDSQGIFGIAERDLNPNANDINASSDFGVDGNITIMTIGFEPFQETAKPPANIVKSDEVVARICDPMQKSQDVLAGTENRNTLSIKGRGKLPADATESLISDNILLKGQSLTETAKAQDQNKSKSQEVALNDAYPPILTSQGTIYPARGMTKNHDGTLILTAYPTNINKRTINNSSPCNAT